MPVSVAATTEDAAYHTADNAVVWASIGGPAVVRAVAIIRSVAVAISAVATAEAASDMTAASVASHPMAAAAVTGAAMTTASAMTCGGQCTRRDRYATERDRSRKSHKCFLKHVSLLIRLQQKSAVRILITSGQRESYWLQGHVHVRLISLRVPGETLYGFYSTISYGNSRCNFSTKENHQ